MRPPERTSASLHTISAGSTAANASLESSSSVAALVEVKSLGGSNFVRPDRVIAIQTSPTGTTLIVMEGGTIVNSSEPPKAIAARLDASERGPPTAHPPEPLQAHTS